MGKKKVEGKERLRVVEVWTAGTGRKWILFPLGGFSRPHKQALKGTGGTRTDTRQAGIKATARADERDLWWWYKNAVM